MVNLRPHILNQWTDLNETWHRRWL